MIRESLSNSILESRKDSLNMLIFAKDGLQSRSDNLLPYNQYQENDEKNNLKITQSVPLLIKTKNLDDSGFSFRTRPTPNLPNELNNETKVLANTKLKVFEMPGQE